MNLSTIALATAAVMLFSCVPVEAQELAQSETQPKTKIEAFQAQTGAVVIKGYSEIGRVNAMGSVEVSAMEFTDASTSKKQTGVLIEIKAAGRLENEDRSFIDYDEISALLEGLDYIGRATADVTKLGQFEATYKTKGYFSATAFNNTSGKISAAVKSGYIRPATAYLSLEQLKELRGFIAQAKEKLDATK